MNDLVKRLRKAERSEGKWGTSLSGEAADEIERLKKLVESQNTILTSSTNGRVRKAVIEDMRKWCREKAESAIPQNQDAYLMMLGDIDDYCKDRGVE